MNKFFLLFGAIFILVTKVSLSQVEPLDLAQHIFYKEGMKNIEKYSTGEYKGEPSGKDLASDAITTFKLLSQNDAKAVVAMTATDSTGKGFDSYLFFEKQEDMWKMSAFRSLAMTGMLAEIKNELEKMTPQQIDEAIKMSKENPERSMFTSREDFDQQLGNIKLTLELDENIIKHFLANQKEFERLRDLALKQCDKDKPDSERSVSLIDDSKEDYKKIFISSVTSGGYEFGNCINFLIGGMIDNSVGYIFVRDKKDLPEMSPDRIIMLREIGNGWYIYKTT